MSDRDEQIPAEPDVHLNALRIRQVAAMRRATYRSRSHAVIAAAACAGIAAQLAWLLVRSLRASGGMFRALLLGMLIIIGVLGAVWFARRAIALHRETKASRLVLPADPAEFSRLSDGSQFARNLEDVQDDQQDPTGRSPTP